MVRKTNRDNERFRFDENCTINEQQLNILLLSLLLLLFLSLQTHLRDPRYLRYVNIMSQHVL